MLKFNETAFEEIMGMTPEEAIETYEVDVSKLESVANALNSGKFAWGGSPTSYFGSNGMVFEGEFSPLDTPELRNSYMLIAFVEAGGGLKVADSKDDMGVIARWDVEPLEQLKGAMSETFVPDLGVDVDPDKFYVMADSGAMYGGVQNAFDSEEAALNYAMQDAEGFDPDVDQVVKGSDIIAAYQAESKLVQEADAMQSRAMIQALGSEAEASGELGEKISALILQAGKENRINAGSYEGILSKLSPDALDALYTKAVGLGMKGASVDRTDGSFDQKMAAVDFLKKKKDKELIKQVNGFEKNANPIYRGPNSIFNLSNKGYLDALAALRKAGFSESMTESGEDGGLSKDRVINELVDEVGQAMEDSSADAYNGLMAFEAEVKGSDKDFYSWDELAEMFDRHGLNQDDLEWFRSMNESDGPFEDDQATLGESDLDLSGYDAVEVATPTDASTRTKNQNAYGFGAGRAHYPVRNAFQKIRVGDVVVWDEHQGVGKGKVKAKLKGGMVETEDGQTLSTMDVIAIYRPKKGVVESDPVISEGSEIVSTHEYRGKSADVYKEPSGKFRVRFYRDGKPMPQNTDLVTKEKDKAQAAAKQWIAESSCNDLFYVEAARDGKTYNVVETGTGKIVANYPTWREAEDDRVERTKSGGMMESFGQFVVDSVLGDESGVALVSFREGTSDQGDYAVVMNPDGRIMDGAPLPELSAMVSAHSSFNDALAKFQNKVAEVAKANGSGATAFPVVGLQIDDPAAVMGEAAEPVNDSVQEAEEVDSELLDQIGPALIRAQTVSKDEQCGQHVNKDKETGNYYVSDWYDYEETVATFSNGRLKDSNLPPGVEAYFNYFQESSVYSIRLTANDIWRVFERGNPVAVAGPFDTSKEASDWVKSKGVNESFQTSPFEAAGLNVDYNEDRTKAIIHVKDEAQFLKFQKAIDLFGGQDAIGKFEYKVSESEDELYTIEVEMKQYDSGKASDQFMKEMDPNGQQK